MKIIFLLVFLILSKYTFCQAQEEISLLIKHLEPKQQASSNTINPDIKSSIISTLFSFYKEFISSQDYNSCVFSPSCSEYAVMSIKKQGLFWGIFDTFDRLSRCHGFSFHNYETDTKTNRLKDPVKNLSYEDI